MATRRRYAAPKYRDGGAVPIAAEPPLAEIERETAPARADAPQPAPSPDSALLQAIEGQRRAEELQRQAVHQQRPTTIDDHIETMPISEFKKATLRAHPQLLDASTREIAAQAYQEALAAGIEDDTPDMTAFMLSAVRTEMQERRQRLAEAARAAAETMGRPAPPDPMMSPEQGAERLQREADALVSAYNAESSSPRAMADHVTSMAPPTPARRSMPMTAPVTRDVPSPSGRRLSSSGHVTLTAEERFIARHSYSDPNMSDAAKEAEYARQKSRLARLRHEGLYPERERG